MATKLEIINLAFSRLGQKPSSSTSEASVQMETALREYDPALKDTLKSRWPFATVIEKLTYHSTYATVDYAYAYTYPASCMALWVVFNGETIDRKLGEKFRVLFSPSLNASIITTDCSAAYAEYSFYNTNTSIWDPAFVQAFAYRLAAAMAVPLNGNSEMAKDFIAIFNTMSSEADRLTGYENNEAGAEPTSQFYDAR